MISQFADIFVQMVVLFAVGATGYAAKRLNLMDEDFDKKFSKLILNTALPALILASVLTAETLPSATKILWTAGVSCASYVVLVAIGFSITAALRVPDGRKGVFRFMMVFGNTGFIGFPVTAAVFGAEALIYTTVFNLAFNALVFTLGVWMLATDNKYGVKIKMSPKSFLSPCIVASVASIALAFAGIHGVPVLGEALDTLGSLTTPAAMLIIGSSLANVPARQLVGGPRLMAPVGRASARMAAAAFPRERPRAAGRDRAAVGHAGGHERHHAVLPVRRRQQDYGAGHVRHHAGRRVHHPAARRAVHGVAGRSDRRYEVPAPPPIARETAGQGRRDALSPQSLGFGRENAAFGRQREATRPKARREPCDICMHDLYGSMPMLSKTK